MKTYAALDSLKSKLGITGTGQDAALARALVGATRAVDLYLGDLDVTADDVWTDGTSSASDLAAPTPAPAAYADATIALAVRHYKSADVPFGVAGMTEAGMTAYVRSYVPEVEILLGPHKTSWGIG